MAGLPLFLCERGENETGDIVVFAGAWDTPGAQEALVVLAHDAGHWLDYRMRPYPQTQPGHPRPRREHAAIVLGWKLLGIIEAHKLVTWARWADHHRPVRRPEAAAA
jgi:hypothetical protein